MLQLTRRAALLGLTSAFTLGRASLALAAAPTEQRFVVVILRGALDGMSAVVPYGDPALAELRGESGSRRTAGSRRLLRPASVADQPSCHVSGGRASACPCGRRTYRVRSHFEAQDCLESGADHRMTSGWLNRAVGRDAGRRDAAPRGRRIGDRRLGAAAAARHGHGGQLGAARRYHPLTRPLHADCRAEPSRPNHRPGDRRGSERARLRRCGPGRRSEQPAGNRYAFPALARAAGEMLRAADGPRIAALEIGGWDTHVAQVPRLTRVLKDLDAGLAALKDGLGPAWQQTAVLVDDRVRPHRADQRHQGHRPRHRHRRLRLGGAVAGGRVAADWPGLGAGKLLEDRDLQPTRICVPSPRACWRSILGLAPRHSPPCFRTARRCSQWPV